MPYLLELAAIKKVKKFEMSKFRRVFFLIFENFCRLPTYRRWRSPIPSGTGLTETAESSSPAVVIITTVIRVHVCFAGLFP